MMRHYYVDWRGVLDALDQTLLAKNCFDSNTNSLLRQYFPKGTDLAAYAQVHLNKVARMLNERPRKTPGFETLAEIFTTCVAATD